jgi:hypothetical protein
MRRRLAVIPAVAGATLIFSSAVAALGTLDQSQTVGNGNVVTIAGPPAAHGQTFTAGLTGLLDTVSLNPAQDLIGYTIEIRDTAGGLPGATVLASQTVTASTSTGALIQIPFTTPASVTAGTQYAIVAQQPVGSTQISFNAGQGLYAAGDLVIDDGTGFAVVFPGWDLAFETYVTGVAPPTPTPSPTATPQASLVDAAAASPSPLSGLVTLGFALLLISSLGVLLVANVRAQAR